MMPCKVATLGILSMVKGGFGWRCVSGGRWEPDAHSRFSSRAVGYREDAKIERVGGAPAIDAQFPRDTQ